MKMQDLIRVAATAAAVAAGGMAHAVTTFTFGQATQIGRANTVRWAQTSAPGDPLVYTLNTIVRSGLQPRYDFTLFFRDGTFANVATRMTILATSTSAATLSGPGNMRIVQGLDSGIIRFTALSSTTIKGRTGTNVLTASFTGGQINGTIGETALSFQATEPSDQISYSSTFFDFTGTVEDNFAFAFTSVNPAAAMLGSGSSQRLRGFTASSSSTLATSVPEPSTWAMLILGFGMVGYASRRRRLRAA